MFREGMPPLGKDRWPPPFWKPLASELDSRVQQVSTTGVRLERDRFILNRGFPRAG